MRTTYLPVGSGALWAILLLAAPAVALKPPMSATVLVRVDDKGRVLERRDGTGLGARLHPYGWVKALRPPGVCVRTALYHGRPAWVERTWMGWVVWDTRGLELYRRKYAHRNLYPLPQKNPEGAKADASGRRPDQKGHPCDSLAR